MEEPWKEVFQDRQGSVTSNDAERRKRTLTELSIGFGNMKVTVISTRAIPVEFQRQKPESSELKRKLQSKETETVTIEFCSKSFSEKGSSKME